jgi:hypothetical protein
MSELTKEEYELEVIKYLQYPELQHGQSVEDFINEYEVKAVEEYVCKISTTEATKLVAQFRQIVDRCFDLKSFPYFCAKELYKRKDRVFPEDLIQNVDDSGEDIVAAIDDIDKPDQI